MTDQDRDPTADETETDLARDVTRILADMDAGDEGASERLLPLVYEELRRIAASYMRRERKDHTLEPTALVHEAFLRLVGDNGRRFNDRMHFFAVAARAMRQILIDSARRRNAAKRGGGADSYRLKEELDGEIERDLYLVALDEALDRLAKFDPRQARIVELRFFGGLTIDEASEILDVGHATVERDWRVARAWLHREISRGDTL